MEKFVLTDNIDVTKYGLSTMPIRIIIYIDKPLGNVNIKILYNKNMFSNTIQIEIKSDLSTIFHMSNIELQRMLIPYIKEMISSK